MILCAILVKCVLYEQLGIINEKCVFLSPRSRVFLIPNNDLVRFISLKLQMVCNTNVHGIKIVKKQTNRISYRILWFNHQIVKILSLGS